MTKLVKIPQNWGLTRTAISQMHYPDLERTFYGIHNLKAPFGVLDRSNPDEIMAYYDGACILKKMRVGLGDFLNREARERLRVASLDIGKLVKSINEVAFASMGFRLFSRACKKTYFKENGTQEERLNHATKEDQKIFLDSFTKKYIPSLRESSAEGGFYDPNIDGKSREVYINKIWEFIKFEFMRSLGVREPVINYPYHEDLTLFDI